MLALVKNGIGNPVHVAQQALVLLAARQHVDDVPKAGPATAAHDADVPGDQAGGGADCCHTRYMNEPWRLVVAVAADTGSATSAMLSP